MQAKRVRTGMANDSTFPQNQTSDPLAAARGGGGFGGWSLVIRALVVVGRDL